MALCAILACTDPYAAADTFVERLGWSLVFATPRESADRLACVELGDAQVMLGVDDERFLAYDARPHRGAGIQLFVQLPGSLDITEVYARHRAAGVVTQDLSDRDWGAPAFEFAVEGYRFLVAGEPEPGGPEG